MRRSFLFASLIGLCSGLVGADVWAWPHIIAFILAGLSVVGLAWSRTRMSAVLVLAAMLGVARWHIVTTPAPADVYRLVGKTQTVVGDILQPPAPSDQQVIVLSNLRNRNQRLNGKLQVWLPLYPTHELGQRLTLRCKLQEVSPFQHWRMWSHGIHARCFQPTTQAVSKAPRSVRLTLGSFEVRLIDFIRHSFNEPQASLLAGIMLGDQTGMPQSLNQAFQATGTTHIIALSGFNVTIIVSAVMVLLVRLIGRRWAWLPSLALVVVFVLMTGASASVVRAAIMAVISQLAMSAGRPIHPARLLAYTALGMLWQNPLILLYDLGFQLSFLATIGLIFMSKPMTAHLTWVPDTLGLRENLGTTLAAIIATEPLLLWQFGRLSVIAPLINVLVLPFIPLAMGLGTLCLLGLLVPILIPVLTSLTDAILRLVLGVITTAAAWPWSLVHISSLVTATAGASFVVLAGWLLRHTYAEEPHPA